MLLVQQTNHLPFGNNKDPARGHRGGGRQANRLAGKRSFAEKIAWTQYADDRLLASRGHHRQLHAPLLNVEDGIGCVALREDGRGGWVVRDSLREARRIEEGFRVECALSLRDRVAPITLSDGSAPVAQRHVTGLVQEQPFLPCEVQRGGAGAEVDRMGGVVRED